MKSGVSEGLKELILRCLKMDSKERISIEEVVGLDIFKEEKEEKE